MTSKTAHKIACAKCKVVYLLPGDDGLWPKCPKGHAAMHLMKCNTCGAEIGQVTDDDYCGPEQLACPGCIAIWRRK